MAPASAATAQIGAVSEIGAGERPDPITSAAGAPTYVVQVGEATGTYAVPTGYGVITSWQHSTGSTSGRVTFKVYRPTGVPNRFLVIATDPRSVTAGTVHSFPVQIPVRPGDRVGISTTSVEVAFRSFDPTDEMGIFPITAPDPAPGTNATLDGPPFKGYRADVVAHLESDVDYDGVPDSRDGCPTEPAATPSGCAHDTTAPSARLRVKRTQRLHSSLVVGLSGVSEFCRATLSGTLSVPGGARAFRLRGVKGRTLATGSRPSFRLKLSRKARAAAKRALRKHRKVRARVKIVLTDPAGNSRTLKTAVRLKR